MSNTVNEKKQNDKSTDYSFFYLLAIMGLSIVYVIGYAIYSSLS